MGSAGHQLHPTLTLLGKHWGRGGRVKVGHLLLTTAQLNGDMGVGGEVSELGSESGRTGQSPLDSGEVSSLSVSR